MTRFGDDLEYPESAYIAVEKEKYYNHFGKQLGEFLREIRKKISNVDH